MADAPHCGQTTAAAGSGVTAGRPGLVGAAAAAVTGISAAPHWSQ
jgi:hypothetical protein